MNTLEARIQTLERGFIGLRTCEDQVAKKLGANQQQIVIVGWSLDYPTGIQTACCGNRIPQTLYWHTFGLDFPLQYSSGKWWHEFGGSVLIRDEIFCHETYHLWYYNRYFNGTLVSSTLEQESQCDPFEVVFGSVWVNTVP